MFRRRKDVDGGCDQEFVTVEKKVVEDSRIRLFRESSRVSRRKKKKQNSWRKFERFNTHSCVYIELEVCVLDSFLVHFESVRFGLPFSIAEFLLYAFGF